LQVRDAEVLTQRAISVFCNQLHPDLRRPSDGSISLVPVSGSLFHARSLAWHWHCKFERFSDLAHAFATNG